MQISRFTTGGFVIHKMLLQYYKGHFSAWYDAEGKLLDAEQIFSNSHERSVVRGGPIWQRLQEVGKRLAICPA